jgi:hypothetical protein
MIRRVIREKDIKDDNNADDIKDEFDRFIKEDRIVVELEVHRVIYIII